MDIDKKNKISELKLRDIYDKLTKGIEATIEKYTK